MAHYMLYSSWLIRESFSSSHNKKNDKSMVSKMGKRINYNDKNKFCSVEQIEDVVYLKLDIDFIFEEMNLRVRDYLMDIFNQISKSKEIKVLVIANSNETAHIEKYLDISKHALESKECHDMIHRVCNVFDQLILNLANLKKFTIHSDGSKLIPLFFNLSFACDYRIIASHAVYQKSYLEIGSLPKGGSAFFLSKMLEYSKAKKMLLSSKDISAPEALELGIVDQVVPFNELEDVTIQIAKHTAQLPEKTVLDIKKLVNYSINGLTDYLRMESRELLKSSGLYDYF
jgi:enoyl-CoA hydratase/carnithine racemase